MHDYSAFFSPPLSKKTPIDDQFAWWEDFILYFVSNCDTFRIECFSDTLAGLQSCAKMGASNIAQRMANGRIEVWEGAVCQRFVYELAQDPFCQQRNLLKWDRIFLRHDQRTLVSVTMGGGEISLHGLTKRDLQFAFDALQSYDIPLCYWENVESGRTVPIRESFRYDSDLDDLFGKGD